MPTKIATWNLDHAYKNNARKIESQIEIIKGIEADIWVLTETCSQVDLSQLGYKPVIPEFKNKYKKYWSTIWSRLPIRREIRTDPSSRRRPCLRLVLGLPCHPDSDWILVQGTCTP
jgi:hypothetical protein